MTWHIIKGSHLLATQRSGRTDRLLPALRGALNEAVQPDRLADGAGAAARARRDRRRARDVRALGRGLPSA